MGQGRPVDPAGPSHAVRWLTARAKLLRYLSSSTLFPLLALMALTPQDIAAQAGQTAKAILGIPAGVIGNAYADYIKSPPAEGLIPNLGVGIARQACRRYADSGSGLPGSVAAGFERVCRPYLDSIGYGAGPKLKPPFKGGQCAGTYLAEVYVGNTLISQGGLSPRNVTGPLGGVSKTFTLTNQPVAGCGRVVWSFSNNPAANFVGANLCGSDIQNATFKLTRVGGGADNCGDPPPLVTSPTAPAPPTGPTEPYAPNPDLDVNIDVDIGPQGDITFNIGTGPITIDPFGGGGGDGGDGDNPGIDQPGTAPSSGLPPGDIGQPGTPSGTAAGGDASGEAPPNSVLVGLKVNIVSTPQYGSEYDPNVRRGVCYVYMGTPGNLALDVGGVAMRSGQFFFAPIDNLTAWRVDANSGYVLQVIPYYRALELTEV